MSGRSAFVLTAAVLLWGVTIDHAQSKRQMPIDAVSSFPVVDSTIIHLDAPTGTRNTIILLQTGDTVIGKTYYSLHWQNKRVARLSFLTPSESRSAKSVALNSRGTLAFTAPDSAGEEHLFIRRASGSSVIDAPFHDRTINGWSRDDGARYEESNHFPSYELSPNGDYLIAYANRDLTLIDTGAGTVVTQFVAARLSLGETKFRFYHTDTVSTAGFFGDERFNRNFADWANDDPNCLLFSDFFPGQLSGHSLGLWRYNTIVPSLQSVGEDVEEYFSASLDGHYLLYTNNDETCCAGTNYTDNLLIRYEPSSREKRILFDEWAAYHNEGKAEEHVPMNGELSPDNRLAAATIRNYVDLAAKSSSPGESGPETPENLKADKLILIITPDGTVYRSIRDRELLGWLDNDHILVRPYFERWGNNEWVTTEGEMKVIEVRRGREYPLLTNTAEYLSIERSSQK